MKSKILESLRECCNNTKSYIVIYDGAGTGDLPLLVCEGCLNKPSFQKFILAKFKFTQKNTVEDILRNYLQN
ncbi:hypothetical protein [Nitrosopumilus sp.]|uniref:hypothetical protein n=1 Tax=Nitrosopumilus sp. TaxID=2024843 RepID=UPI00247C740B|nr:hypothetical protein [Nitrosopumilus sp.]MCV0431675.1 hypothetical protein [Nitrosopumilus sp.]